MGDDETALERVGRSRRPGLWIGAWVVGLGAIVAVAVVGRGTWADVPAATPIVVAASAAPVVFASPNIPDSVPRVVRPFVARVTAPPRPRPTPGDDGLVGGTSYSSAAPAD